MKVSEILKKNEVTISCEIFPPKQGAQLQNYKAIAAEIAKLKPAYISCTYGATGGTSDYTVEIADAINSYGVPAIAHLTERCLSHVIPRCRTVIPLFKFYFLCHIPSCRKLQIQINSLDICLPSVRKRNIRESGRNADRTAIIKSFRQKPIYQIHTIRIDQWYKIQGIFFKQPLRVQFFIHMFVCICLQQPLHKL